MAATAQSQAEVTKEAQKAGIAHALANDDGAKYRGRKPTFTCEQFAQAQELLNQGLGISAVAKSVGLKRQSVYRIRTEPEQADGCATGMVSRGIRGHSYPSKAMLLDNIGHAWKRLLRARQVHSVDSTVEQPVAPLTSIGFDDFLAINMPRREMLLAPILPEKSLAMLYAPRGIGKTLLALSIGLAVASGSALLRWNAPRQRRVLYVDGEMPLSRYRNCFEQFRTGLTVSFQMMDFECWQQTIQKTVFQSEQKWGSGHSIRC